MIRFLTDLRAALAIMYPPAQQVALALLVVVWIIINLLADAVGALRFVYALPWWLFTPAYLVLCWALGRGCRRFGDYLAAAAAAEHARRTLDNDLENL